MTQPEIAKQLKVGLQTIINWEMNKKQPRQTQAARIINFIGYMPFNLSDMEFREQLRMARMVGGLSIEQFGKDFDCDASNLSKIELGKHIPALRLRKKLETFIHEQFSRFSNQPV